MRADHQEMFCAQLFRRQGGIHHQCVIRMDKSFFTTRFPSGGAKAAKGDINGILHLRQRVGELWIVRVIDAGDIQQRATRRGGDIIDMPILDQQPQQMSTHQPGCAGNQYLTHLIPFTELSVCVLGLLYHT